MGLCAGRNLNTSLILPVWQQVYAKRDFVSNLLMRCFEGVVKKNASPRKVSVADLENAAHNPQVKIFPTSSRTNFCFSTTGHTSATPFVDSAFK